MLQFLTHKSDRYSIAEEAQMALEGGCKWIQLTASLNPGDSLKEVALELLPLCEENEAFMIIDSDVELCNELRVHGVYLHKGDISPIEAREKLGPHAVIGAEVETVDDILALKGKDIDYVVLGPFSNKFLIEDYRKIISQVRDAGMGIHIVAGGRLSTPDFKPLLEAGVNGFAVSEEIIDAADPVITTKELIDLLSK